MFFQYVEAQVAIFQNWLKHNWRLMLISFATGIAIGWWVL